MYQVALTVFLSWSGTEATSPDLAEKTAIVCSEMLLDFFSFTEEPWEKPDSRLLLRFRVMLVYNSLVNRDDFQDPL